MRLNGRVLMSFSMGIVSAGVILTAMKWPFKTALFPVIMAGSLFLLTAIDLVSSLLKKERSRDQESTVDFKLTEDVDAAVALRRTIVMSGWILGFFLMIMFFGFPIAVPLMVFLYLKLQGREGWRLSIILTGVSWLSFYGLFVYLLDIPFPEGWIFKAARSLGIG